MFAARLFEMTKEKKKKGRTEARMNWKGNGMGIGMDQMLGNCFICSNGLNSSGGTRPEGKCT